MKTSLKTTIVGIATVCGCTSEPPVTTSSRIEQRVVYDKAIVAGAPATVVIDDIVTKASNGAEVRGIDVDFVSPK